MNKFTEKINKRKMELQEILDDSLMGAPEIKQENLEGIKFELLDKFYTDFIMSREIPKFKDDDRELEKL